MDAETIISSCDYSNSPWINKLNENPILGFKKLTLEGYILWMNVNVNVAELVLHMKMMDYAMDV